MGIKKKIQGIQKFGDLEIGQLRDPGIQKSCQFRNPKNRRSGEVRNSRKSEVQGSQKSKEVRNPENSGIWGSSGIWEFGNPKSFRNLRDSGILGIQKSREYG